MTLSPDTIRTSAAQITSGAAGSAAAAQGQPSWIRDSVISPEQGNGAGAITVARRPADGGRRGEPFRAARTRKNAIVVWFTHFGSGAVHRRSLGPTSSDNAQSHKPPPRTCRPATCTDTTATTQPAERFFLHRHSPRRTATHRRLDRAHKLTFTPFRRALRPLHS